MSTENNTEEKTGRLSFNKKDGDFETIDQQHLSNCWWFLKVFGENEKTKDTREMINRQLIERFNGHLFPYRPHVANLPEIKELEKRGMLKEVEDEFNTYDIIFSDKKIGKIRFAEAYTG